MKKPPNLQALQAALSRRIAGDTTPPDHVAEFPSHPDEHLHEARREAYWPNRSPHLATAELLDRSEWNGLSCGTEGSGSS